MKYMHRKFIYIVGVIILFFGLIFAASVKAAIADQIDGSVKFFVDRDYDFSGRSQINATLKKISEHAYFYLEDTYFNSLNSSERASFLDIQNALAQEFDSVIYPGLTRFYGSEWNPGIDNDSKITLLFTPMVDDAGGYFRTNDEFLTRDMPDSNQREMIYFNVKHASSVRAKSLLAHEFHHLVNFYQKDKLQNIAEEVWLNEMRSEYAPTVLGYDDNYNDSNIKYREKFFTATPNDPLAEWLNKSEDYGVINFFAQYFIDHYGENIFSSMISNNKKGIDSINKALGDNGFNTNFNNIFSDWTIANIINDCLIGQGLYCYKNNLISNIKIEPTVLYDILNPLTSVSVGGTIDDWSARWYKFLGQNMIGKTMRIDFQGVNPDGYFRIPYVTEKKDGAKSVKFMEIADNRGFGYIKDFGDSVSSVIVIPASHLVNIESKSYSDKLKSFTLGVNIIENTDVPEGADINGGAQEEVMLTKQKLDLPDGSLARAKGDYGVYIINGSYKRHILDGRIFDFYGHLSWDSIHEVDPEILAGYQESFLVRVTGDRRVYEINGDKTKHWLNMSAESFALSGRRWDAISIINEAERNFYVVGSNVEF